MRLQEEELEVKMTEGSHLVTATSRVTITGLEVNNNSLVSCTEIQYTREGTVLHSSTVSLHINVVSPTKSLRSEDSFFFVLAFIVGPSLAVVLLIGECEQLNKSPL